MDRESQYVDLLEEQSGNDIDLSFLAKEPKEGDNLLGDKTASTNLVDIIYEFLSRHSEFLKTSIWCIIGIGYLAYLITACIIDLQRALPLLIFNAFVLFCVTYVFIRNRYGENIYEDYMKPLLFWKDRHNKCVKYALLLVLAAFVGTWIFTDTIKEPQRFMSFGGFFFYVFLCYLFSNDRKNIKWAPVIWGFSLQIFFGFIVLRTYGGYTMFKVIGDLVADFLDLVDVGAEFVFGENFKDHYFAFKVIPTTIFFSSFISVCYYLGIMQLIIEKISWLMMKTMGTSAVESLSAAANIFVGQTEAPLLIRPFVQDLTMSELHAVMTGGFATIAGGVLAAYIQFGISASHLISASVMAAPGALAISKLLYPETEKSKTAAGDQIVFPQVEERNVVEAAASGASNAISLAANIVAMVIAFLSLVAFLNAILGWLGGLVDYPGLSFDEICGYLFLPFSFFMGVPLSDCVSVSILLGQKTFLNEFIAYSTLSEWITNRDTGGSPTIQIRSEVIATYALCGFANVSSIGVQLGGLTPMAPLRKRDIASLGVRAMIAGTLASFLTACIAGTLYDSTRDY